MDSKPPLTLAPYTPNPPAQTATGTLSDTGKTSIHERPGLLVPFFYQMSMVPFPIGMMNISNIASAQSMVLQLPFPMVTSLHDFLPFAMIPMMHSLMFRTDIIFHFQAFKQLDTACSFTIHLDYSDITSLPFLSGSVGVVAPPRYIKRRVPTITWDTRISSKKSVHAPCPNYRAANYTRMPPDATVSDLQLARRGSIAMLIDSPYQPCSLRPKSFYIYVSASLHEPDYSVLCDSRNPGLSDLNIYTNV